MIKLWIDDVRPAPEGWRWAKSVHEAKIICCQYINPDKKLCIETISLDHDSGFWRYQGGDYINLLSWLEKKQYIHCWDMSFVLFQLHSQNPVGVANMRRIIERNGWREIK